MSTLLRALYGYHAWANSDLLDKLEMPDRAAHSRDRHTAIRLINHYYVVAEIFAAHLRGVRHRYKAAGTVETPSLSDLRAAITASDQWYLNYVQAISPSELSGSVPFTFTDGDKGYMTREEMLTHVVLHGGYHRGEVGRILSQRSVTPPHDTFAVYLHRADRSRRRQGGVGAAPD